MNILGGFWLLARRRFRRDTQLTEALREIPRGDDADVPVLNELLQIIQNLSKRWYDWMVWGNIPELPKCYVELKLNIHLHVRIRSRLSVKSESFCAVYHPHDPAVSEHNGHQVFISDVAIDYPEGTRIASGSIVRLQVLDACLLRCAQVTKLAQDAGIIRQLGTIALGDLPEQLQIKDDVIAILSLIGIELSPTFNRLAFPKGAKYIFESFELLFCPIEFESEAIKQLQELEHDRGSTDPPD